MQRDDEGADPLVLPSSPSLSPPSLLPYETPVVWKHQQQQRSGTSPPTSHSVAPNDAHIDPTSAAQTSKSFFGRIRVIVRCRPLQRGIEDNHTDNRVYIHGDEVLVCEKNNPSAARSYRFDRVLPPDADQVTTFAEVAPLVDHVLDGFHATIFAYGQTGSGKTYTMDGLRYVASSSSNNSNGNSGMNRLWGTAAIVPDLEGTPMEQHGIMPRIIQLLFDRARARQRASGKEDLTFGEEDDGSFDTGSNADGVEYTFRCSYYQIYNEKITDLLRTTGSSVNPNDNDGTTEGARQRSDGVRGKRRFDDGVLRVRWQKGDIFKVENLFVCSCGSPEEMREMLFTGIQQKVVSSHMMNYQSSRSHCVFTIYVECRSRNNGELRSQSEMSLVDLAGSEKICQLSNNPTAKLVKESIDINTSLLALGKVIMALSSSTSSAGTKPKRKTCGGATSVAGGRSRGRGYKTTNHTVHIPYRDSKLTMLLKHALGGNSLTTMIACISPSDRYVEETTSTLLYAGRAKNIRNAPRVNEDATTTLIRQLREEIAQLKAELGYYREMAAKSLGQQQNAETKGHVCSRCGGSMITATGTIAASPHASSVCSVEAAVVTREAEQLADSLIAACEMLKNTIAVNAELRESYDALRDAQEGAERREGELNAENLALRERLSVLEGIVLQDDDDEGGEDDNMEEEEASNAATSLNDTSMDSVTREALEAAKQASKAAAALRTSGGSYRNAETSTSSLPPTSPQQEQQPPPQQQMQSSVSTVPLYTTTSPTTATGMQPAVSFNQSPRRFRVEPIQTRQVSPSTSKEALPPVVTDGASLSPAFGLVTPVTAGPGTPTIKKKTYKSSRSFSPVPSGKDVSQQSRCPQTQNQRQRKKARKKKKHRVLERRLKEYEQRYRAPSRVETYEDYYNPRPKRGKPHPVVVSGMVPTRAFEPEPGHTTATLEDMKTVVAKLPKNVVSVYVPASLLRPGLFGTLAFGGAHEERREFERHRSDRAARLRILQQHQQTLYQQVHQAVRDVNTWQESQPSKEKEALVLPEQSTVSGGLLTLPQRIDGENDEVVRSYVESGGRRSSSEQLSLYASAPLRAQTAVYNDSKVTKKGSNSRCTTDSMMRLLEYLDKEKS